MLDLAAAGTGQVALVQWLELQHQRELLPPPQSLADDIRRDPKILAHRDGHWVPPVRVITDYLSMHYYKTMNHRHDAVPGASRPAPGRPRVPGCHQMIVCPQVLDW
jgi:hypothetical protein